MPPVVPRLVPHILKPQISIASVLMQDCVKQQDVKKGQELLIVNNNTSSAAIKTPNSCFERTAEAKPKVSQ